MKKLLTIILFFELLSMSVFSINATAQVDAKATLNLAIEDTGWKKIIRTGTNVTIFAYKHKKEVYTFGVYSDDYAGIIDLDTNPFDIEEKKLKKLPNAQGKKAKEDLLYYGKIARNKARENASSGKYKVIATDDLWRDYDCIGKVKKGDTITIIGYKKKTDEVRTNYYYAILDNKAIGVFHTLWDVPIEVNIPVDYLPSTDDAQVHSMIERERRKILARREEEKKEKEKRAHEEEIARIQRQHAIRVAKLKEQQHEDSLVLARMKQKYLHKTWYYRTGGDGGYRRFEPIEVIDIQSYRDPTYGNHYFPMKLRYKRTNEVVSFDAIILDDNECTFDVGFTNVPPEKEFPTVRHWKAVKNYEIVLGMNKVEVELVWGYPDDINTSEGRWGVHEQWVYYSKIGGHPRYLYFDNGRLTAIQR